MKKHDLKKLALLGIIAGTCMGAADSKGLKANKSPLADQMIQQNNESNMNYHLMSEDELLLELNPQGESTFKSLDQEGKKLALYTASMMCSGTNLCKGLNACKTDDNECAGKGACKGLGKCAFSDKNLAVKVVADKMKAKRSALK